MLNKILILPYLLQINRIGISDKESICISKKTKLSTQIECYKDGFKIYSLLKSSDFNIIGFGFDKICYQIKSKSKIICEMFNTDKEHQIIHQSDNRLNLLSEMIIGQDFICGYNLSIQCFGSSVISENVPNYQFNQFNGYTIKEMQGNQNNICVSMYHFEQEDQLNINQCWGESSTGINEVPSNIRKVAIDRQYTSMGQDTVCIFQKSAFNHHLSQCWGRCPGHLCTIPPSTLERVEKVKVGHTHACILNQHSQNADLNHFLSCWGGNEQGQSAVPVQYKFNISEVAVGQRLTCAMKNNFKLKCWGHDSSKHVFLERQREFLSVATGGRHSCAARLGHQVCWGSNEQGQLELGKSKLRYSHASEAPFFQKQAISAGWDFTCFLTRKQQLKCVGFNQAGQVDLPADSGQFKQTNWLKSGLSHSCLTHRVETEESRLVCWGGLNEQGQVNVPDTIVHRDIMRAAVGHDFTCITLDIQKMFPEVVGISLNCFGNNDQGQSVSGETQESVRLLTAGGAHGCLYSAETVQVQCWGSDSNGQLKVPAGLGKVVALAAGDGHSCAVEVTDISDVVCWGLFKQRMKGENALQLDTSQESFCIVDVRGQGHCWGDSEWGQCDIPHPLTSFTNYNQQSINYYY